MNLNKVFILGRLTADPQLRATPAGQSVASLSVATNRVWTDKSGARRESTEYHNVVVWGRQAEIAVQFLKKGGLVLIEGRLQTRVWQDKQGQSRKTTDIICERLQLGPRPVGVSPQKTEESQFSGVDLIDSSAQSQGNILEEEIPVIDLGDEGEIKADELPF